LSFHYPCARPGLPAPSHDSSTDGRRIHLPISSLRNLSETLDGGRRERAAGGKDGGRGGFGKAVSFGVPEKVGIILRLRFDSALAAT
jgi:hypothetical protein